MTNFIYTDLGGTKRKLVIEEIERFNHTDTLQFDVEFKNRAVGHGTMSMADCARLTTAIYGIKDKKENSMTRNENITRLAARAVDFPLGAGWIWIDDGEHVGFFECFGGDVDLKVGFAPLSSPADAYRMEDKLRMEVTYRVMAQAANGGQALVISVRTQGDGGAIMHTVPDHHASLKGRMFAVTQFAALNCLMEDKDDPVERPLSMEIRNG